MSLRVNESEDALGGASSSRRVSTASTKIRSMRAKPKSFSAWRENVREACQTDKDVEKLTKGSVLWKVRRKRFQGVVCYCRFFRLNMATLSIQYSSESKKHEVWKRGASEGGGGNAGSESGGAASKLAGARLHVIDIADIVEVREGFSTDTFNEAAKSIGGKNPMMQAENAFSIIFDPKLGQDSLDLLAESKKVAKRWARALRNILRATKGVEVQKEYELYLRNHFQAADEDSSGCLSLDEFPLLLRQLNINLSANEIEHVFNAVNTDQTTNEPGGEQVLDEREFIEFYHKLIERKEVKAIFQKLAKKHEQGLFLTLSELKKFLRHEQHYSDVTDEECRLIIEEYEPSAQRVQRGLMSSEGFSKFFLFSSLLDLLDQEKLEVVYQDMNQPLSHYYISASHNTYLVGNQMTSESSIDGYIRALQAGCRCVEMDCWDGPRNEPVVCNGWSFTSKLDFREILEDAIKPYAFSVSEFPLIISIENHCSRPQQDRLAEHLMSILGEYLYSEPIDPESTKLPSPNALRRKILVKADKMRRQSAANEDRGSDTSSERSATPPPTLTPRHERKSLRKVSLAHNTAAANLSHLSASSTNNVNMVRPVVETVSRKFSELVNYCESTKFRGFESPKRLWEMSSLEETKAKQLATGGENKFIHHNRTHLTRIFPKKTRLMSSNFDPVPFWLLGCQLVALNYQQARDRSLALNRAMFRQNGQCGYVLKPAVLRDGNRTRGEMQARLRLRIKVISGQHLPKSEQPQKIKGHKIIEPYVKVRVRGHPDDEGEYVTKVVPRNGFNPTWNETAEFHLRHAAFAFIEFRVKSRASAAASRQLDELLGSYVVPLTLARRGYRHVYLESLDGVRLTPASLFVHIHIKEEGGKK